MTYRCHGKRVLDVLLAATALIACLPILVPAGVLVRLLMGAPVLFRDRRIGRGGVPFTLLKLRSMRTGPGADAARLTRLGAMLRATSVDELPQLLNILRGEMSLVGPRPLPLRYADRLPPQRHAMRPGLTGPAQLAGRNALDWPTRLALDLRYVAAPTPGTDLRLLLRTPLVVLRGGGVASRGHVAGMPLPTRDG